MSYKLRLLSEKNNNNNNIKLGIGDVKENEEYVLEITSLPPPLKTKTKIIFNNNNNEKQTRQCLDIFKTRYDIREDDVKKGRNIFCPIHEKITTSKTPSAKFNVISGYLTCFSSNCTIPVNKRTGYRQLWANELLKILLSRK